VIEGFVRVRNLEDEFLVVKFELVDLMIQFEYEFFLVVGESLM
jgi:hypothetical protein